MSKSVTLSDIAKICGTSTVTVSKALADKKGVGPELRERIKKTADELGYTAIHSVSISNNRMVGVLIPEKFMAPKGSFYWSLYNELVVRFKEYGFFCLMEILTQQDEQQLVLPDIIKEHRVSAFISLGQVSRDYAELLYKEMPALLQLDYYISGFSADHVITNGFGGCYEITSYLISVGHKNIGFIGTVRATSSIFDRYMGYTKAMLEHGLAVKDEWILDDRDGTDFVDISFPETLPTAFVCNCDETAYNVIRQLKEKGISVPHDISIVGFDNYLISELCDPPITTMGIDVPKMACAARDTLLARINDPDLKKQEVNISCDLIVKGSTRVIDQ